MLAPSAVPKITVTGNYVQSNAVSPRHIPGNCACWDDADRAKAKRLMLRPGVVACNDATAYAAMLAIGLDLMYSGRVAKAELRKQYVDEKEGKQ